MSLIKAEKLTFAYPGSYDNIFENADFRIDTDWKLGFARRNNTDESVFKALLQKLGLGKIQFEKDMREFSEGQKKKVLIAKSLSERAHLYIWDEPLNYIDIYSRIQIEELINTYSPTIVFAEHDSAFRGNIGAKVIKI